MKIIDKIKSLFSKKPKVVVAIGPSERAIPFNIRIEFMAESVGGKVKVYINGMSLASLDDRSKEFISNSPDAVNRELIGHALTEAMVFNDDDSQPLDRYVVPPLVEGPVNNVYTPIDKSQLN